MASPQWEGTIHELPSRVCHVAARLGLDPEELLASARALALALDVGVWTHDQDFFGSGIPTWRTEVLLRVLEIEAEE